jgi:putative inorganic carbon (HCO3(-)) transporter
MGTFGDKSAPRYVVPDTRAKRAAYYTFYALFLLLIGAATVRLINPLYIIGGVVAATVIVVILKYPFFGFFIYLAIYYMRPGERLLGLGALRLELMFGAFLLAMILISDGIRGRGIRFPKDKISISLAIIIGVMMVSMVFSEWVSQSYDGIITVIKKFILYYFVVVLINTEKRFQIVFWLVVLFTSFVGIEATVNYYSGNYVFDQGIMRAEGQTSYGHNFNSLAMYMATTVPLLLYLMTCRKKALNWLICLALIGGCLLTLMITGSRSGLLCIIAVVLTYAWFSRHRLIYFLIIIVTAISIWTVLPEQYRTRYSTMTEGEVDASTQGRINAWKAGVEMFLEKPIFGVGPAVFTTAYGTRYGVWLASHSLYVEMFATLGIAGVIAWWFFMYQFLRKLWGVGRWASSSGTSRVDTEVYVRAIYSIIVGLLVAGVFGHILFRDTWFIMAGLTVARENLLVRETDGA